MIFLQKNNLQKDIKMQLTVKTILNSLEKHSHFVYQDIHLAGTSAEPKIEVNIKPRKGSKGLCQCGKFCAGYDTQPEREYAHVPLWNIPVIFKYAPRRVDCEDHGVTVEVVPWSDGKSPVTKSYAWFLSQWGKVMSWQEVARRFNISWHMVFTSVKSAVEWGRIHMDLNGITAIGVDEIHWKKGKFMTLVYQINGSAKRLLWCAEDRTEKSLNTFFDWFGKERSALIEFACTDMWKPYLNVLKERAASALNVLDRFHIAKKMNEAIDKVRATETKALIAKGKEVILKHSRWCILKRSQNLTDKQRIKLKDLLQCNLQTIRAYLLKEDFRHFWNYESLIWASKFLDLWCKQVMRSKIEPMKDIAKMLRRHKPLILNWFAAKGRIHLGAVEGLNNRTKVAIRKSYGFKAAEVLKISLYHKVGDLPVPAIAHRYFS